MIVHSHKDKLWIAMANGSKKSINMKAPQTEAEIKQTLMPRTHKELKLMTQHAKQQRRRAKLTKKYPGINKELQALRRWNSNSQNQNQKQNQQNCNLNQAGPLSGGSKIKKTRKYKGRRYKIRYGSRGGKYIHVSGKKIYI